MGKFIGSSPSLYTIKPLARFEAEVAPSLPVRTKDTEIQSSLVPVERLQSR